VFNHDIGAACFSMALMLTNGVMFIIKINMYLNINKMKTNLKKASLLLTGILVGSKLLAQAQTPVDTTRASTDYVKPFSGTDAFRTWSIGVNGGLMTPYTIFGSNRKQDFTHPEVQFGYGAYIKDQILPSFGISANFLAGKLEGQNSQPDVNGNSLYASYSTKLHYSASLNAEYDLANINWHVKHMGVQPYFTMGFGTMNYTPVLTGTNGVVGNFKTDNNGSINEVFLPVGVGFKFNVAPGINIDLGYQVNFVYSDNADGYNYGANDDRFSYAHLGLEFALGKASKPQLSTHNPVNSMREEYLWENRNTKNTLQAEIDAEKAKNDQLRNDLNTTNANLAKFTTDSDGDGVPDFYDKCPNTPAGTKVDGSGCPLPVAKPDVKVYVTEQDKEVVKEAIRNLEFDFGKATIREHSFLSLDKVAQLLIDKKFHLKLAGYTDNVGSVSANLRLSKNRAEAIKTYLVNKGADASLIAAEGYGKSSPIASNKTAKGRQINRRVEFSLY
jgi:OOP family OmpA-OmpF porin